MRRFRFARRVAGVGGLTCIAALMLAAPCAAYTPPETNPRIVLSTPNGPILIALAPENAPKHVEQFLGALAAGDFNGSIVTRVEPEFYMQLVAKAGSAQLAGLAIEQDKVGNVRGAFSVYDGGEPGDAPTFVIALVTSPQLDADYTPIGFVEAGMGVVQAISDTPTVGDHQPYEPIRISEIHIADLQEKTLLRQADQSAPVVDEGTSLLAGIFIIACAAFLAALISSYHDRLGTQRVMSLMLMVALLAFFAVWVSFAGTEAGSGLFGVALFGGAIAMFRLMGGFERPATSAPGHERLGEVAQPRQLADRKLHAEHGVDQSDGDLEVGLDQRDASPRSPQRHNADPCRPILGADGRARPRWCHRVK